MFYSTVGGVSAAVSKTAAAPIERVKLLIQNQVSFEHARSAILMEPPPFPSQSSTLSNIDLFHISNM